MIITLREKNKEVERNIFDYEKELLEDLELYKKHIPALLETPDSWKTLFVDYEFPHVERLYMPIEGSGIFVSLHKIHPCPNGINDCLIHRHDYPTLVHILQGEYEMEVAHEEGAQIPKAYGCRNFYGPGSTYIMASPDQWHRVNPVGTPTYSIMITGLPFARPKVNVVPRQRELTTEEKHNLIQDFKEIFRTQLSPQTTRKPANSVHYE